MRVYFDGCLEKVKYDDDDDVYLNRLQHKKSQNYSPYGPAKVHKYKKISIIDE